MTEILAEIKEALKKTRHPMFMSMLYLNQRGAFDSLCKINQAAETLAEILAMEKQEMPCGCNGKSGRCYENAPAQEYNDLLDTIHAKVREVLRQD